MSDSMSFEQETEKKPGNLKVLTLLTFIGCGLQLILTPASIWFMKFSEKAIEANPDALTKMTPSQQMDYEKGKPVMDAMLANQPIVYLMTFIGVGLCFYGALTMRKLKKEGFYFYVLGQIVPIIIGLIFLGFSVQFSTPSSYIFGLGIPAVFIVLYGLHLKYMTK